MTNRNETTGIRYGVISGNSLDPDVLNELFYGSSAVNVSFNAAYDDAKREFEAEFENLMEEAQIAAAEVGGLLDGDYEDFIDRWFENKDLVNDLEAYVDAKMDRWNDQCQIDEPVIEGEYEGVKYLITWLGGAPLVYVIEGPTGYANRLCSPCVPGAADLDGGFVNELEIPDYDDSLEDQSDLDIGNVHCYVVPKDWLFNLENR